MKQDGVSNDPATFSCHMFTYALVCAHKKVSEIDDQNRLFGLITHPHIGLGRMCNLSVSALGPDSMLCQHIFDVNSWHSCLPLFFSTLFPCICLSLTDRPNFTPFQNVEYWTNRDPFYEPIPSENITQNFNIIWNQNELLLNLCCFSFCQKPDRDPPSVNSVNNI